MSTNKVIHGFIVHRSGLVCKSELIHLDLMHRLLYSAGTIRLTVKWEIR